MSIVRIREVKRGRERFVPLDDGIGKKLHHRLLLRQDAVSDLRHPLDHVPCPFIKNSLGPSSLKNFRLEAPQKNIPLPVGKEDVRIQNGHRLIEFHQCFRPFVFFMR